jgi:hypothetical protein
LVNQVSPALATLSRQFASFHGDAEKLNTTLAKMQRLTMLGGAVGGAGLFGIGMLSKALKPAEEYVHQLNIMNTAGLKQAEIAQAVGDAWKLAGDNITTTATGNLKALLDLRNVTGSMEEARAFLPIMQQMQTVLAASKEGKVSGASGDLAFSAMKALDIRGAVNDPENLRMQAAMMTRVIEATQGRVTPQQFQQVFQYARQAKFSLSDDFAYSILPTLMLEAATNGGGGGGSRGVGPGLAALYRVTNQGYVNKKSLPLLQEMGLLTGRALETGTTGTVTAPLAGAGMAAANPFQWATQVVAPAVRAYLARNKRADTTANELQVIGEMFRGNQLAASLIGEFIVKQKNFERDQKLIQGVMDPAQAYRSAMSRDPATAHKALDAAWENFQTSLTMNVVPIIVPALLDLARGLNTLGNFARAHPNLTKDIVIGFGALAGVMAVGGPLIVGVAATRIAFAGLPAIMAGASASLGGFGALIGKIGALGLALTVGYKAGSWLSDHLINGTSFGDWIGRNEARVMAMFGSEEAKNALRVNETVRPANKSMVQVNTKIHLDGQPIANVVSHYVSSSLGMGMTGGGVDPNVMLPMPGVK